RRARDVVDGDALILEVAQECHVGVAPRASAAEGQTHRVPVDHTGQPREGASERGARGIRTDELPDAAPVERRRTLAVVGDTRDAPRAVDRLSLQLLAGIVAEDGLDRLADSAGRAFDRAAEEPREPDALRALLLAGEVRGRHAVHPREVFRLWPGIVGLGVV